MKKKNIKKHFSIYLSFALLLSLFYTVSPITLAQAEEVNNYGLSNPRTGSWDCVYFGYYWQNDTNGDGIVNKNDAKQPIKWRVLSVNGNNAFLLADQNLDCKKYNETLAEMTWETCTLRQWLNYNFYQDAFNSIEKLAILTDDYGDKIGLLSDVDASNPTFGFQGGSYTNSDTRKAKNTEYAKEHGAYYNTWWWLQTQGDNEYKALVVDDDGAFDIHGIGVDEEDTCVRPTLQLNLSSDEWCKAGTINSSGIVTDSDVAVPTAKPAPTATPNITEDTTPSFEPTATPIPEWGNSHEIHSIEFEAPYSYTMAKGTVITIPRPQFFYLELKEYEWGIWGKTAVPVPPEEAKNKALIWTSSNPEICTVDANGKVLAKNYGTTLITARTDNGKYDTISLNVCKPSLSRLSTVPGSTILQLNETDKYKVSYTGKSIVDWSLSKKNILKIESKTGNEIKLRAIKPGKVTLFAKVDGFTMKRNIKVVKPRLELKKLTVRRGKRKSTYVTSSEYLSIKWSCKNKKIVSLSHDDPDIEIKGKREGKTWVIGKIQTKGIKYKPTWKIKVCVTAIPVQKVEAKSKNIGWYAGDYQKKIGKGEYYIIRMNQYTSYDDGWRGNYQMFFKNKSGWHLWKKAQYKKVGTNKYKAGKMRIKVYKKKVVITKGGDYNGTYKLKKKYPMP